MEPKKTPKFTNSDRDRGATARQSSDWDIRNIFGNYAALLLTHFLSALFSLGAVWLITRILGSEGYGWVVAVIAASQVAQVFLNWTALSVVRFGVDEFIDVGTVARIFWSRLLILAISVLFVLSLSGFWFPRIAGWLELPSEAFVLVLLHLAATAIWIHVQMGLQAVKMPRVQGFLLLFERVTIFAGLISMFAFGRLSPTWAIACYLAGPILASIVGIFKLRHFIFRRFVIDALFVRKVLFFSVPLLPMAVIGFFSGNYVDAIFISELLSTRDLGIYSVAAQINGMVLQLPTIANTLLLPFFVTLLRENGQDRLHNYFQKVLPGLTLLWAFGCTAAGLGAYFILPLVFGAEFGSAAPAVWILFCASAITLPALLGYFPFTQSLSATYISLVSACFAAVANIAANIFLIPRYGLVGCAAATMISFAASVTVSAFMLKKIAGLAFSWNLLAIAPSIIGGSIMTVTGNVWIATAATLFLLAVTLGLKRNALIAGMSAAYRMVTNGMIARTGNAGRENPTDPPGITERFDGANALDRGRLSPYWGEHVARYSYAKSHSTDGLVLDIACGTGYGLGLLKLEARFVVGVDVSTEAARAALRECDARAGVLRADGIALPFADGTFDLVTSFETIEHLFERDHFLTELHRVMRSGALLLISTPNAKITEPIDGKPKNSFHVHEYMPDELLDALGQKFRVRRFMGQSLSARIIIPPFEDAQRRLPKAPLIQARLFCWKLFNKLPVRFRETLSKLIWGRPFYPLEDDYEFSETTAESAPVLVAVCVKE